MGKIIPNISPRAIDNNGERRFYEACLKLSDKYEVFYSFKYKKLDDDVVVKEADFVICCKDIGYITVEVKQGQIRYQDGQWMELKNDGYRPLSKNPIKQSSSAMYAIKDLCLSNSKNSYFSLFKKYTICFPECAKVQGTLPAEINEDNIFLSDDLFNLEEKLERIFKSRDRKPDRIMYGILVDKILNPTFQVYTNLEHQIERFHKESEIILTSEQEDILQATEYDRRKIYLGAAGTGKTFVAIEKSRRLAEKGKKVLLTCFNKNLANYKLIDLEPKVTVGSFHDYALNVLDRTEYRCSPPEEQNLQNDFYKNTLPDQLFEYYSKISDEDKFDAIVVDEGQDFTEEWILCLETMLKQEGEFYIFADLNQDIFKGEFIKRFPISKHQLTKNLRNTEIINEHLKTVIPDIISRSMNKGGLPVHKLFWKTYKEQKKLIEDEIGRLVSQGVNYNRITILSPYRKENSCLAEVEKFKEWPLIYNGDLNSNGIKYFTIRSFKGLESDIVFLIDMNDKSEVFTKNDCYVGSSRARFLLYTFEEMA